MKTLLIAFLYFSFLLWPGSGSKVFAQNQHLIDSLQHQLENYNTLRSGTGNITPALYDSVKADLLNGLSKAIIENDPTQAMEYANRALKLSQQIGFKKGIGNAFNNIGLSYKNKGQFLSAIEYFKKSLSVRTEAGDKAGMAFCYNNIGGVYFSMGSFPLALQNHLVALKIRESINDKISIASSFNNIGMIYMMQGAYEKALTYFNTALKINRETGNKNWESANLENIGLTKTYQNKFSEALLPFYASLKILKQTNNLYSLAGSYLNIGDAYTGLKNYSQALGNYFSSLKINIEMDDKEGLAISNMSIGTIYVKQKEFNQASEFLNKGLLLAKEIGSMEVMKKCYEAMAIMDSAQGNVRQALINYKQFIAFRDSMFNIENTNKTLALQLQYETEKKAKQIALLRKENDLQRYELQKQKLMRNALIAACVLILILAVAIFNRYYVKKKANAVLEKTLFRLKTTQEQLIEHEKLASLGKYTAEVAREMEIPFKKINSINKTNIVLIKLVRNEQRHSDLQSLKSQLNQISDYGKTADSIVKKILVETRKMKG